MNSNISSRMEQVPFFYSLTFIFKVKGLKFSCFANILQMVRNEANITIAYISAIPWPIWTRFRPQLWHCSQQQKNALSSELEIVGQGHHLQKNPEYCLNLHGPNHGVALVMISFKNSFPYIFILVTITYLNVNYL